MKSVLALVCLAGALCVTQGQYPIDNTDRECPADLSFTDTRPDGNVLRIATWNMEWFFDDSPPYANRGPGSPAALQERVNRFADAIHHAEADVWNLNEIEGCFMLNRLFNGSSPALPPVYSVAVGESDDSGTGQHLGLLTRVPFAGPMRFSDARQSIPQPDSRCGSVEPRTTGASKHYVTTLHTPQFGTLVVGGVHFKSAPNDGPSCAQREGQAKVFTAEVQAALDAVGGPAHVVVLGDFNDFNNAVPDVSGSTANSRVVEWIARDLDLRAVTGILPAVDRHTWGPSSSFPASQLDHMLVSPGLFRHLDSVSVNRSASTYPSLADHAPIIATFTTSADRTVPPLPSACEFLYFTPPACGCPAATCPTPTPLPSPLPSPTCPTPTAAPSPAAGSGDGNSAEGVEKGGESSGDIGTTAGVAVGTFLIGLLLGWAVFYFRLCGGGSGSRGSGSFSTLGEGVRTEGGAKRVDRVELVRQG